MNNLIWKILKYTGITLFIASWIWLLVWVYIINHNITVSYDESFTEHSILYQDLCKQVQI